jgi:hypothetical protein
MKLTSWSYRVIKLDEAHRLELPRDEAHELELPRDDVGVTK